MYKPARIAALFLLISILSIPALYPSDLPKPTGHVNDFAGMLGRGDISQLESACVSIQQRSGSEIAIVTMTELSDFGLEEMALKYLMDWGVGQKGQDNGIVILIVKNSRQLRIEVGYGLEGTLPDGLAGEIIRYDITPRFKQGDYAGGLAAALYKIDKILGGEQVTYPKNRRSKPRIGNLIYLVFLVLMIISAIGRKGGRGGRGGRNSLLWLLIGMNMGRSGGFGSSGGGGFSSGGFGGFGGGMGGGGGASGGW